MGKIKDLTVNFQACEIFEPEDCNLAWRQVFTLSPAILLDLWTPVILGTLGMAIHIKALKFTWVKSYAQYALFMAITALCANVGYCAQCGILVAVLSALA